MRNNIEYGISYLHEQEGLHAAHAKDGQLAAREGREGGGSQQGVGGVAQVHVVLGSVHAHRRRHVHRVPVQPVHRRPLP